MRYRLMTTSVSLAAILGITLAACGTRNNVQCQQNANCDLSGGGVCVVAPTGNHWCAYPDPNCSSGYRFSTVDVGDGVSGVCTDQTSGQKFTLTVAIGGSGSGNVTSTPSGLTCTATMCTGMFASGTQVQLAGTATAGSFLGWSDACQGTAACVVTMDRDRMVGVLFGTPGQALWVKQLGALETDRGNAIASDSNGDIIVVGGFRTTIQAGSQSLVSAGGDDIFVVKLTGATGDVVWAKRFGGSVTDSGLSVAVDSTNNIYVTGNFMGPVNFGGGLFAGSGGWDVFLLKLDTNGNHVWSKQIGGTGDDSANSISVKGTAVAIAGTFHNTMTVNGTALISAGVADVFVAKLTTDGSYIWAKRFGTTTDDLESGVAIDGSGNVVVAGSYLGTVDFGGGGLTSAGGYDMFLLKLAAADGAHLLSKRFGSTQDDSPAAVVVDASNNMFIIGYFRQTVDFGGASPLTAGAMGSVVLAKYTLAGANVWAKPFTGTGFQFGTSATINAPGDVAIAGFFCGTINFGGQALSSASACSNYDIFAARFSGTDGSHINAVRGGGTGSENCNGVTQTSDGRFFVTGGFTGFAEFGGQALTSAGAEDVYILGLAPL